MATNKLSLFSIIQPDFFGLLSGKNKNNNFLLLVETNKMFGTNLTLERKKLLEALSDYIFEMHFEGVGDIGEEDEIENYQKDAETQVVNSATKANLFLNSLVRRGWLDLDQDEDLNPIVSRTDAFIAIYNALISLIEEDTNAKEYATPLWTLYQSIENFDFRNATIAMQAIEKSSNDLSKSLLSINSRIKRFVNAAMTDQNVNEKEILKKLTIDYQKFPAYIAFHNLLTKNNPNKYSNKILNKLCELEEPACINQMVSDYILTKNISNTEENVHVAESYFQSIIRTVEEQMDNIESSLDVIGSRNRAYVKNSSDRIRFRLNNERNLKGEINSLLKKIKIINNESEDTIGEAFKLYSFGQIDNKSLFTARSLSRIAPKKLPFIEQKVDEEALQRAEKIIRQTNMYSINAINDFVLKTMKSKKRCMASEFKIEDMEQFIKLLLVPVYSSNSDSKYTVTKVNESIYRIMGYDSQDYEIRIKEDIK